MMTPWLWRLPDDIWCLFISLPLVSPCLSPQAPEDLCLSPREGRVLCGSLFRRCWWLIVIIQV